MRPVRRRIWAGRGATASPPRLSELELGGDKRNQQQKVPHSMLMGTVEIPMGYVLLGRRSCLSHQLKKSGWGAPGRRHSQNSLPKKACLAPSRLVFRKPAKTEPFRRAFLRIQSDIAALGVVSRCCYHVIAFVVSICFMLFLCFGIVVFSITYVKPP